MEENLMDFCGHIVYLELHNTCELLIQILRTVANLVQLCSETQIVEDADGLGGQEDAPRVPVDSNCLLKDH